jgi:PKD repeat protein
VGPTPHTVQFLATITGGDARERLLHCPSVEWDFQDGKFHDQQDCEPFERGGTIRRSYSTAHTFETPGKYRVRLTLRQNGSPLLTSQVTVEARKPGLTFRY